MTGFTVQAFGLIIGMGLAAAGLPVDPGTISARGLTVDPASNYLYTSLGREVHEWTRDSSVSLWDTSADRSFGGIYPFSDGNWAAVMADGTVHGSTEGRNKVGIMVRGRLWENGRMPAPPPSQGQLPEAY